MDSVELLIEYTFHFKEVNWVLKCNPDLNNISFNNSIKCFDFRIAFFDLLVLRRKFLNELLMVLDFTVQLYRLLVRSDNLIDYSY